MLAPCLALRRAVLIATATLVGFPLPIRAAAAPPGDRTAPLRSPGVAPQPAPTWAEPSCDVADLPPGFLREAMARVTRPGGAAPAEGRPWHALLPARISATWREQTQEGIGTYAGSTGLVSERLAAAMASGYAVRLEWDLRPLWAPVPRPVLPGPAQRLEEALKAEQLGARLAAHLKHLRQAQALAAQARAGDPVCHDAQSQAEAALLVLLSTSPPPP